MSTAETPKAANGIDARLALIALLVIQIGIGYEWFMSGLTKIYRGTFAVGLAADLREKSPGAEDWYRTSSAT